MAYDFTDVEMAVRDAMRERLLAQAQDNLEKVRAMHIEEDGDDEDAGAIDDAINAVWSLR